MRAPRPGRFFWVASAALGIPLFGLSLFEIALRMGFRCDLLIWSESPFMTNLIKLTHGLPIYTAPSDLNSYIYSPGLEYLTYAILAPIGLALDVRFCRMLNVLVGIGAALTAAAVMTRVEADLRGGSADRRVLALGFCTTALIIFNSPTADGLHPDNLHMLHASTSLLLCYEALRRRSTALAAVAIAVAGLGVVVKQPAALAPIGTTAALLFGWKAQPRRTTLLMLGVFALMCAFALWFVFADSNRRFFLLEVAGGQAIMRWNTVARLDAFFRGHRLLLSIAAPACWLIVRRAAEGPGRSFLLAWLAVGLTEAAPNVLPALKIAGIDNNFTVMSLWLLLLALPAIAHVQSRPSPDGRPLAALLGCIIIGVLVSLVPTKLPPSPEAHRYCDALVSAVGDDIRAGRRILVSKGTTPFVANGVFTVPLDRATTAGEVWFAGRPEVLQGMRDRLARGYYDRLYVFGGFLAATTPLSEDRYRKVAEIPSPAWPAPPRLLPFHWLNDRFVTEMRAVTVYELRR